MIERETAIKVYNETLGVKGMKGRLVRIADGYYEVILEINGRNYTSLLPIGGTAILAVDAEEEVATIQVER